MNDSLNIPDRLPNDYHATRSAGLTAQEVADRVAGGAANHHAPSKSQPVAVILAKHCFTFFNFLNVCLALCLILVQDYRDMMFMGVVLSNTLIGTIQELRARKTIQKLQLRTVQPVHVLRDGRTVSVKPDDLVRDDLVVLQRGDQVPADAIVHSGTGSCNESMLTGESDAVAKHSGDWVLSGTYITEGSLTCQLVYVGRDSYLQRLERTARRGHSPKSELMQDLQHLIRRLTLILIPSGLLLFARQYFTRQVPLQKAVPQAVAAMIGMIPEGLMLLTSVALMVGVIRLGKKGALVQDLYSIESLARVDVLCLDKTGTLTTGRLRLEETIPLDASEKELDQALLSFLSAFTDDPSPTLSALSNGRQIPDPIHTAILPFSSDRKLSAVSFPDGTVLILGAPEFVLGNDTPLMERIQPAVAAGKRVVVLARTQGNLQGTSLPSGRKPIGLFLLSDELRPNLQSTFQYFEQEGVTLKLISGDHPDTVAALAARAGLPNCDRAISLSGIGPDADYQALAEQYTVFGRVSPEQKQLLVRALKANGHHVAMTGDGVNDIPALKASDCSIAIGGGSEATQHASKLTLISGDFGVLPMIVSEGRRVINNITRTASLFLVKTIYSLLLCVLIIFLPVAYPFRPIQLTLISAVCVGIPSFFLAMERNDERVHGRFISTIIHRALPGAVSIMFCALSAMFLEKFDVPAELCHTLATLSAGVMGLTCLALQCLPMNRYRLLLLFLMAALFVGAIVCFSSVFYLVPIGWKDAGILAVICLLGILCQLTLRRLMNRKPGTAA